MDINNNYYQKYLKYKTKYLNLLAELEGGGGSRGRSRHHKNHNQRHQQRHKQRKKRQDDDDAEYDTLMAQPILTQSTCNQDHTKNQEKVKELIQNLRKKQANCIYQTEHDYNINEIQKQKDIMVDTIEKILPNIKNVDIGNYINKSLIDINKIIVKPEDQRKKELENYLINSGLIKKSVSQPINDVDLSGLFNQ